MKALFLPIIGVAIFIAVVGVMTQKFQASSFPSIPNGSSPPTPKTKEIKVGRITLNIEVANTPDARKMGLSGRDGLNDKNGMLFVFEKGSFPTFWMKDMKFPLDFIWIKNGKITKIEKNVPAPAPGVPDRQLNFYHPDYPIDYVLEVNGGFSDKNSLKADDSIDLSGI